MTFEFTLLTDTDSCSCTPILQAATMASVRLSKSAGKAATTAAAADTTHEDAVSKEGKFKGDSACKADNRSKKKQALSSAVVRSTWCQSTTCNYVRIS